MTTIATTDGVNLCVKHWGRARLRLPARVMPQVDPKTRASNIGGAAARRIAVAFAAIVAASTASAETLLLSGRIEAAERAVLSSRLDGFVTAILFDGGERVERGQPLIRLDPADAELALAAAEARLAESLARLAPSAPPRRPRSL